MATDEEKGNVSIHYITGFGELASLTASDADHTTEVYKRFDRLAARDLLYYECELLELEALQDRYDCEDALDARRPDDAHDLRQRIRTNARDWMAFKHQATKEIEAGNKSDERWKKRMDLAMQIRSTLKEYREALVLNSTLLSLRPPSKQTLTTLSNCFHQQHVSAASPGGQPTTLPILSGAASTLYPLPDTPTSQQPTDLVSLAPQTHTDPLTLFLKTYCSWLFRFRSTRPSANPSSSSSLSSSTLGGSPPTPSPITHPPPPQLGAYSLPLLSFTASLFTTLLTSILLFLPIFVLYSTPDSRPGMKLGWIALFTLLFAGAIPLVTNARRAEVFAACAAYAAVLVVFVSGNIGARGTGAGGNGGYKEPQGRGIG